MMSEEERAIQIARRYLYHIAKGEDIYMLYSFGDLRSYLEIVSNTLLRICHQETEKGDSAKSNLPDES